MTIGLPIALFLGVVVYLLVRSGELRVWQVVLVGLFGFYLAESAFAVVIKDAVTVALHAVNLA